jgi:hypothetical protein
MERRQSRHWGLRAVLFAAILLWQAYELVSAFALGDVGYVHYLIFGVALVGLIASLMKLVVDY